MSEPPRQPEGGLRRVTDIDIGMTATRPPELAQVFSALASADRLAILAELRRAAESSPSRSGTMTISEVALRLDMSRFSASRHLNVLREAGLVECVRSDRKALHSLSPSSLNALEDWLYPLLDITAAMQSSTA